MNDDLVPVGNNWKNKHNVQEIGDRSVDISNPPLYHNVLLNGFYGYIHV